MQGTKKVITIVPGSTQAPISTKTARILAQKRSYEFDRRGLEDEQRVIEVLRGQGHDVLESEEVADICYDIDCYLDGVPTSIKAQHTGLSYGDIYVELTTEQRNRAEWTTQSLAGMQWLAARFPSLKNPLGWSPTAWQPSWFFTGKAEQYLILQGDELRLYRKLTLAQAVTSGAFYKVRGLSKAVLEKQNGRNTICLYGHRDRIDYEASWVLTDGSGL